jgi:hypothetical protein
MSQAAPFMTETLIPLKRMKKQESKMMSAWDVMNVSRMPEMPDVSRVNAKSGRST